MGRRITKIETTPPLPTPKRMVAYARVSCGKDEMLHSLAAQVSFYSNLIQSRADWVYGGVYADSAETGTKDTRPEFQRLLADCRAGLIDEIITKSISRFARNTVTLLETVRELKSLGIGVYFEEQRINTLSADGELMLTILASYAQEESRSVSENCKWRIRKNFKEGKPSNNIRIYGYDYREGKLIVDPEAAEVVRMIFADYLSGLGKNAIMKKLTQLGVPTKCGGRKAPSAVSSPTKSSSAICACKKAIWKTISANGGNQTMANFRNSMLRGHTKRSLTEILLKRFKLKSLGGQQKQTTHGLGHSASFRELSAAIDAVQIFAKRSTASAQNTPKRHGLVRPTPIRASTNAPPSEYPKISLKKNAPRF